MRTILTAAIVAASFAGITGAHAADVYSPGGYKDTPVLAQQAPTWTGFYVGANVGGGWAQLDSDFTLSGRGSSLTIAHTNEGAGIIGGGQAGYNWQTGAFLIGLEGDFGILGFSHTRDILSASFGNQSFALGTKFDGGFSADITGRVGLVSGPALFYIKGGWAYLDATAGTSGINALQITGVSDVSKSGFDGWTLGGGMEYKFGPSWSIKAEYQYFDFGSFTIYPIANVTQFAINNDLTVNTVKVGLNYHVGSVYAPLK